MPFTEASIEALVLVASIHLALISWAALTSAPVTRRRRDETIFFY